MRDRKADRCPACGSKFKVVPNSERHICIGMWRELMCRNCGRRVDEFIPYPKDASKRR